jgi:hypothetical protein
VNVSPTSDVVEFTKSIILNATVSVTAIAEASAAIVELPVTVEPAVGLTTGILILMQTELMYRQLEFEIRNHNHQLHKP